jgi:hypothetical protein
LKKNSLKEKEMQEDFIEELENRGNANINANKEKITKLDTEVGIYMNENSKLKNKFLSLQKIKKKLLVLVIS